MRRDAMEQSTNPNQKTKQMKTDYHSTVNQRIIGQLVQREVGPCVSTLVSELANMGDAIPEGLGDYDSIMELCTARDSWEDTFRDNCKSGDGIYEYDGEFYFSDHGALTWNEEEDTWQTGGGTGMEEPEMHDSREEVAKVWCEKEGIEQGEREVYEHWIVSRFLADKLREQGETVGEDIAGFDYIWGRCTSGQAILLDHVMGAIADSMGILEGQENDWSAADRRERARYEWWAQLPAIRSFLENETDKPSAQRLLANLPANQ
jgi:hypothetical protein